MQDIGRPRDGDGGGDARLICWPPSCADRKGEYRKEFLELRQAGASSAVKGRRAILASWMSRPRSTRNSAMTSTWWSTVSWSAKGPRLRLAGQFPHGGSTLVRRDRDPLKRPRRRASPERHDLLGKLRLSRLGFHHPRDRAAPVFLQRPRFGACPACDGLGVELFFDERLMVPDAALSLEDGAIAPWRKGKSPYFLQTIQAIARHYGFDPKTAWKDLPPRGAAGVPARLGRHRNPVPL